MPSRVCDEICPTNWATSLLVHIFILGSLGSHPNEQRVWNRPYRTTRVCTPKSEFSHVLTAVHQPGLLFGLHHNRHDTAGRYHCLRVNQSSHELKDSLIFIITTFEKIIRLLQHRKSSLWICLIWPLWDLLEQHVRNAPEMAPKSPMTEWAHYFRCNVIHPEFQGCDHHHQYDVQLTVTPSWRTPTVRCWRILSRKCTAFPWFPLMCCIMSHSKVTVFW